MHSIYADNILIIGASGFLGRAIYNRLSSENTFGTSYKKNIIGLIHLDVTSGNSVNKIFENYKPKIVIHCAAFVDVDEAEKRKKTTWDVNVRGFSNVARCAESFGSYLIYISSDYVFYGNSNLVSEKSIPCPSNYYGKTKFEAECILQELTINNLIIRPSILYDVKKEYYKNNFFSIVYSEVSKGRKIIVDDYRIKYPLLIHDVAEIINIAIDKKINGIINVSGPKGMTRYEWAIRIAKLMKLNQNLILRSDEKELGKPFNINMINKDKLIDYKVLTIDQAIQKKLNGGYNDYIQGK